MPHRPGADRPADLPVFAARLFAARPRGPRSLDSDLDRGLARRRGADPARVGARRPASPTRRSPSPMVRGSGGRPGPVTGQGFCAPVPVVAGRGQSSPRACLDLRLHHPVGIVTRALGAGHRAVGCARRHRPSSADSPECSASTATHPLDHVAQPPHGERAVYVEGRPLPELLADHGDAIADEAASPAVVLRNLGFVPSYYLRILRHDEVVAESGDSRPAAARGRHRSAPAHAVRRSGPRREARPAHAAGRRLPTRCGGRADRSLRGGAPDRHVANVRNDGTLVARLRPVSRSPSRPTWAARFPNPVFLVSGPCRLRPCRRLRRLRPSTAPCSRCANGCTLPSLLAHPVSSAYPPLRVPHRSGAARATARRPWLGSVSHSTYAIRGQLETVRDRTGDGRVLRLRLWWWHLLP